MFIKKFVLFCYDILSPKLLELYLYLQTAVLYAKNSKTVHTLIGLFCSSCSYLLLLCMLLLYLKTMQPRIVLSHIPTTFTTICYTTKYCICNNTIKKHVSCSSSLSQNLQKMLYSRQNDINKWQNMAPNKQHIIQKDQEENPLQSVTITSTYSAAEKAYQAPLLPMAIQIKHRRQKCKTDFFSDAITGSNLRAYRNRGVLAELVLDPTSNTHKEGKLVLPQKLNVKFRNSSHKTKLHKECSH